MKCTEAIRHAIEVVHSAGGGRIAIPSGVWYTGAIRLESNCELHLEEGAILDFSDDPADYPVVDSSWEGIECRAHSPLVYAYGCTNLAVTGGGLLKPRMCGWKKWFGRPEPLVAALGELYHWGATNAVMSARDVTKIPNSNLRPQLVQFNRCERVLLDGLKAKESPFWVIHLYHSKDCIVRNLDIYAHGHNNDGVDVEMTQDVLIENCRFDQGDDGVCLKAGRNADAWRLARPTENVVLRNCSFGFANAVLALGSELSGGIRNVWVTDCSAEHPWSVVRLKTNRRRGGFVENVWVDNVKADNIDRAIFSYETRYYYQWSKYPDYELRATKVSNLNLRDISANCADWIVDAYADPKSPPVALSFKNIRLESFRKGMTNLVNFADALFENVTVGDAKAIPCVYLPDFVQ